MAGALKGDDRIPAIWEPALRAGTPALGFADKNTAHLAQSVRERGEPSTTGRRDAAGGPESEQTHPGAPDRRSQRPMHSSKVFLVSCSDQTAATPGSADYIETLMAK